jgi:hypothetical protein
MAEDRIDGDELASKVVETASAAEDPLRARAAPLLPLCSYQELEARGIPKAGTLNMGGSIATGGGLVFIGAANDARFWGVRGANR